MNQKPVKIGPLLVQRIPSDSAEYRIVHLHYWRGYLCPQQMPTRWIEKFGKLIEVRTLDELTSERKDYRAVMRPDAGVRLAYYEVIDAASV